MISLETWLIHNMNMSMDTFKKVSDKKALYTEYDKYRIRAAKFKEFVTQAEIREVAKELVALE